MSPLLSKPLFSSIIRGGKNIPRTKSLLRKPINTVDVTNKSEVQVSHRLFSVFPESWNSKEIPLVQKYVSGTFLTLIIGGGIAANYYDESDKELSRSIISAEIHLLSAYLAFTNGIHSGFQNYLGCGMVMRRFSWIPHYRQLCSISGVVVAAHASAHSYMAVRSVLYFLSLGYIFTAFNEYLYCRWNITPKWMKFYTLKHISGVLIGIASLLLCQSQILPGKRPEL